MLHNIRYNNPWANSLYLLFVLFICIIFVYYKTIQAMVEVWNNNTYAHCYMIFPISGYLIYKKKHQILQHQPKYDIFPLFFIFLIGYGWYIGNIANVLAVKEYALISFIPLLVWLIMGKSVFMEILFPLGFLYFCVPFGDFLIPKLMDYTAYFTVGMLKLSGFTVYREGNIFSIPSSDWSVIEACAGLRYLIASITLGTLFSYINYNSYYRRFIFILFSALVPLLLNGIRAYLIVIIAHFSNMKLGVGIDHFVYGWLFFGIGMGILFWIGSKWSDLGEESNNLKNESPIQFDESVKKKIMLGVCAYIFIAVWPLSSDYFHDYNKLKNQVNYKIPNIEEIGPWKYITSMTSWRPSYSKVDAENQFYFTDGTNKIGVIIEYYGYDTQDNELINAGNILVGRNDLNWKLIKEQHITIKLNGEDVTVLEAIIKSSSQSLIIWRWNWISGINTTNDLFAKILNVGDTITGNKTSQAAIILFMEPSIDDTIINRKVLQNFVDVMSKSIKASLQQVIIIDNK